MVMIENFRFHPEAIEAEPGDTVWFINRDAVPHTATATDSTWDSGAIAGGLAWSYVVPSSGAELYFCRFHPVMRGTLRVR